MRRARVVEAGGGFYHVISRVVARERLLRDEGVEEFATDIPVSPTPKHGTRPTGNMSFPSPATDRFS